jgi:hypothetical protein
MVPSKRIDEMKEWIKCFFIGNGWFAGVVLAVYLLYKGTIFLFSLPFNYALGFLVVVMMVVVTTSVHKAREDKRLGRTTDRAFPG